MNHHEHSLNQLRKYFKETPKEEILLDALKTNENMLYNYMTRTKIKYPNYEEQTHKLNREGITEVEKLILIMEIVLAYRMATLQDHLDSQMARLYEKYFEESMV